MLYRSSVTVRIPGLVEADSPAAAEEAAKRAASLRPGVRLDTIAGVQVTALTEGEVRHTDSVRAWQEGEALRLGNVNQRQRWRSSCLPEQELLTLARAELFRPFGLLTQRRKMVFATIDHPRNERGEWRCLAPVADWTTVIRDTNDLVDWSTTAQPELTSDEWQVLLLVQRAAMEIERHPWMRYSGPEVVGVQVREHKGVCKRCQGAASERSALVSIEWAGRVLSREYVL